jgi:hypothetical protein
MKKIILPLIALLIFSCNDSAQDKIKGKKKDTTINSDAVSTDNHFSIIAVMHKKMKQVSGIVKDGNFLWAICDNPKSDIYKLDLSGNVVQQLQLKDIQVTDVEDLTVDANYLYIADVGDNDGNRGERQIIKINKAAIGNEKKVGVDGEIIQFSFPSQGDIQKKKKNENDCEAIISYKDALYLFTKRRNDKQTELFVLSKKIGMQTPKSVAMFNSEGLITGAAINSAGSEVALVGYESDHKQPFIWVLSAFNGNNFFSGQHERYQLSDDGKSWQVEGITYKDNTSLLFTCEETPDIPAALYLISKDQLKKYHK